jgi:HNH endonuclease
MDRAGFANDPTRNWLDQYSGPGEYGRISRNADDLGVAYVRDRVEEHLGRICQLAGINQSEISAAIDGIRSEPEPRRRGKIFRASIPWQKVASGAQAFIEMNEIDSHPTAEQLLHDAERDFSLAIQDLPDETERMRIAKQRIGQNIFRRNLLIYWKARCPLTHVDEPQLLRASHIKSWSQCEDNPRERLNPSNGLLLSANLDAAFDVGLISFSNDGLLLRSPLLSEVNFAALAVRTNACLDLVPTHFEFLGWHRRRHGYEDGDPRVTLEAVAAR